MGCGLSNNGFFFFFNLNIYTSVCEYMEVRVNKLFETVKYSLRLTTAELLSVFCGWYILLSLEQYNLINTVPTNKLILVLLCRLFTKDCHRNLTEFILESSELKKCLQTSFIITRKGNHCVSMLHSSQFTFTLDEFTLVDHTQLSQLLKGILGLINHLLVLTVTAQ